MPALPVAETGPGVEDDAFQPLGGMPFSPDSFNALNPTLSGHAPATSNRPPTGSTSPFEYEEDSVGGNPRQLLARRQSALDSLREAGQVIIDTDGRAVDPSDHLPCDTWAPEPIRKPSRQDLAAEERDGARERDGGREKNKLVVRFRHQDRSQERGRDRTGYGPAVGAASSRNRLSYGGGPSSGQRQSPTHTSFAPLSSNRYSYAGHSPSSGQRYSYSSNGYGHGQQQSAMVPLRERENYNTAGVASSANNDLTKTLPARGSRASFASFTNAGVETGAGTGAESTARRHRSPQPNVSLYGPPTGPPIPSSVPVVAPVDDGGANGVTGGLQEEMRRLDIGGTRRGRGRSSASGSTGIGMAPAQLQAPIRKARTAFVEDA